MITADVLIVGGGIAGVAAALASASTGARVVLVRRGPGVSALVAGGWIDAPPPPVSAALGAAGLPLQHCDGVLPHPAGTLVHCALAPASHARASLCTRVDTDGDTATEADAPTAVGRTLVCGIAGLPGFRAAALAALWSAHAGDVAGALTATTLTLAGTPAAGWSPVALAAALQRDARLLAVPLAHAAREYGAARAIVPAVLGLDDHAAVHALVEEAAGVAVGEALGVAPSLPGWRLDLALQAVLAAAGVTVMAGSAHVNGASVTVTPPGGTVVTLQAGAIVLAAGKFAGGGITADTLLRDGVRGGSAGIDRLGRRFDDAADALTLTDAIRTAPQPLLAAGIAPDPTRGVFVAGAMRAGVDTAALGLGAAARDGWDAGSAAAAAAAAAVHPGRA